MKKLVVVADDFGFTEGINRGSIEASQQGILTEMSLMMDSPGTQHGVDQILKNDIPGLGIHITLNDIVSTGKYLRRPGYVELLEQSQPEELAARVLYELHKFEDTVGRVPTHINGHRNCHLHPKIVDTICEYALEHDIYVRRMSEFSDGESVGVDVTEQLNEQGVKLTDYIFEHIPGTYEEAYEGILADLSKVGEDSVTEVFFHPAYVDDMLRGYSSLLDERDRDRMLLTDKSFGEKIEALGFRIGNFNDV